MDSEPKETKESLETNKFNQSNLHLMDKSNAEMNLSKTSYNMFNNKLHSKNNGKDILKIGDKSRNHLPYTKHLKRNKINRFNKMRNKRCSKNNKDSTLKSKSPQQSQLWSLPEGCKNSGNNKLCNEFITKILQIKVNCECDTAVDSLLNNLNDFNGKSEEDTLENPNLSNPSKEQFFPLSEAEKILSKGMGSVKNFIKVEPVTKVNDIPDRLNGYADIKYVINDPDVIEIPETVSSSTMKLMINSEQTTLQPILTDNQIFVQTESTFTKRYETHTIISKLDSEKIRQLWPNVFKTDDATPNEAKSDTVLNPITTSKIDDNANDVSQPVELPNVNKTTHIYIETKKQIVMNEKNVGALKLESEADITNEESNHTKIPENVDIGEIILENNNTPNSYNKNQIIDKLTHEQHEVIQTEEIYETPIKNDTKSNDNRLTSVREPIANNIIFNDTHPTLSNELIIIGEEPHKFTHTNVNESEESPTFSKIPTSENTTFVIVSDEKLKVIDTEEVQRTQIQNGTMPDDSRLASVREPIVDNITINDTRPTLETERKIIIKEPYDTVLKKINKSEESPDFFKIEIPENATFQILGEKEHDVIQPEEVPKTPIKNDTKSNVSRLPSIREPIADIITISKTHPIMETEKDILIEIPHEDPLNEVSESEDNPALPKKTIAENTTLMIVSDDKPNIIKIEEVHKTPIQNNTNLYISRLPSIRDPIADVITFNDTVPTLETEKEILIEIPHEDHPNDVSEAEDSPAHPKIPIAENTTLLFVSDEKHNVVHTEEIQKTPIQNNTNLDISRLPSVRDPMADVFTLNKTVPTLETEKEILIEIPHEAPLNDVSEPEESPALSKKPIAENTTLVIVSDEKRKVVHTENIPKNPMKNNTEYEVSILATDQDPIGGIITINESRPTLTEERKIIIKEPINPTLKELSEPEDNPTLPKKPIAENTTLVIVNKDKPNIIKTEIVHKMPHRNNTNLDISSLTSVRDPLADIIIFNNTVPTMETEKEILIELPHEDPLNEVNEPEDSPALPKKPIAENTTFVIVSDEKHEVVHTKKLPKIPMKNDTKYDVSNLATDQDPIDGIITINDTRPTLTEESKIIIKEPIKPILKELIEPEDSPALPKKPIAENTTLVIVNKDKPKMFKIEEVHETPFQNNTNLEIIRLPSVRDPLAEDIIFNNTVPTLETEKEILIEIPHDASPNNVSEPGDRPALPTKPIAENTTFVIVSDEKHKVVHTEEVQKTPIQNNTNLDISRLPSARDPLAEVIIFSDTIPTMETEKEILIEIPHEAPSNEDSEPKDSPALPKKPIAENTAFVIVSDEKHKVVHKEEITKTPIKNDTNLEISRLPSVRDSLTDIIIFNNTVPTSETEKEILIEIPHEAPLNEVNEPEDSPALPKKPIAENTTFVIVSDEKHKVVHTEEVPKAPMKNNTKYEVSILATDQDPIRGIFTINESLPTLTEERKIIIKEPINPILKELSEPEDNPALPKIPIAENTTLVIVNKEKPKIIKTEVVHKTPFQNNTNLDISRLPSVRDSLADIIIFNNTVPTLETEKEILIEIPHDAPPNDVSEPEDSPAHPKILIAENRVSDEKPIVIKTEEVLTIPFKNNTNSDIIRLPSVRDPIANVIIFNNTVPTLETEKEILIEIPHDAPLNEVSEPEDSQSLPKIPIAENTTLVIVSDEKHNVVHTEEIQKTPIQNNTNLDISRLPSVRDPMANVFTFNDTVPTMETEKEILIEIPHDAPLNEISESEDSPAHPKIPIAENTTLVFVSDEKHKVVHTEEVPKTPMKNDTMYNVSILATDQDPSGGIITINDTRPALTDERKIIIKDTKTPIKTTLNELSESEDYPALSKKPIAENSTLVIVSDEKHEVVHTEEIPKTLMKNDINRYDVSMLATDQDPSGGIITINDTRPILTEERKITIKKPIITTLKELSEPDDNPALPKKPIAENTTLVIVSDEKHKVVHTEEVQKTPIKNNTKTAYSVLTSFEEPIAETITINGTHPILSNEREMISEDPYEPSNRIVNESEDSPTSFNEPIANNSTHLILNAEKHEIIKTEEVHMIPFTNDTKSEDSELAYIQEPIAITTIINDTQPIFNNERKIIIEDLQYETLPSKVNENNDTVEFSKKPILENTTQLIISEEKHEVIKTEEVHKVPLKNENESDDSSVSSFKHSVADNITEDKNSNVQKSLSISVKDTSSDVLSQPSLKTYDSMREEVDKADRINNDDVPHIMLNKNKQISSNMHDLIIEQKVDHEEIHNEINHPNGSDYKANAVSDNSFSNVPGTLKTLGVVGNYGLPMKPEFPPFYSDGNEGNILNQSKLPAMLPNWSISVASENGSFPAIVMKMPINLQIDPGLFLSNSSTFYLENNGLRLQLHLIKLASESPADAYYILTDKYKHDQIVNNISKSPNDFNQGHVDIASEYNLSKLQVAHNNLQLGDDNIQPEDDDLQLEDDDLQLGHRSKLGYRSNHRYRSKIPTNHQDINYREIDSNDNEDKIYSAVNGKKTDKKLFRELNSLDKHMPGSTDELHIKNEPNLPQQLMRSSNVDISHTKSNNNEKFTANDNIIDVLYRSISNLARLLA